MTTQPEEAVGSESTVDATADAIKTFEDLADIHDEDDEPEEAELGEESEDEPEIEAEDEELPPIEPPVSLTAEEKEAFKALPREAQEFTARRIGELEKGFNAKAQEAARAVQTAEQQASAQYAQALQQQAMQYEQLAQQILPQRPDPAMLQYDPQGFYAAQANYENAQAQQQQLQQRAYQSAQEAQQRAHYAEQAEMAAQYQILAEQFPDYTDPTNGPKVQAELSAVARELGYPPELIEQARAQDILAMRKVAEIKAKAEKYDALMSKQMSKVRAAKGLPRVAKPGVSVSADATRAARKSAAFEQAKTGRSVAAKADAMAEWFSLNGDL